MINLTLEVPTGANNGAGTTTAFPTSQFRASQTLLPQILQDCQFWVHTSTGLKSICHLGASVRNLLRMTPGRDPKQQEKFKLVQILGKLLLTPNLMDLITASQLQPFQMLIQLPQLQQSPRSILILLQQMFHVLLRVHLLLVLKVR